MPPTTPILADVIGTCSATANIPTTTDSCGLMVVGTTSDPLTYTTQGAHIITWTFTGGNGISTTATQNVLVGDTVLPTISCAGNIAATTDLASCTATIVLTAPTVADNCGIASITNDHASSTYPIGTTIVTWTVTDSNGNKATCEQEIKVTGSIITGSNIEVTIDGYLGGIAVPNVFSNALLNCVSLIPSNVTTSVTSVLLPNIKFDTAIGQVRVDPQTKSGTYTFYYTICELLNPGNCATNSVTLNVTAAAINAVADTNSTPVNGTNGGDAGINVLANDTLNGTIVNPADVVLSSTPKGPLTVNADGTVTVAPNTVAGTYTVDYTICEVLNPTNCNDATITIVVGAATIDAVPDTAGPINGINGVIGVLNVLNNDTVNGVVVNPGDVTLTLGTPDATGFMTLNLSDGSIDIKAGTPAGTYSLTYSICENANNANCDSATVTVSVFEESVTIVKSSVFNDENGDGYAQTGETITYHFAVANTGSVALTNVSVTDNLPGLAMTGSPIAVLAAGETNSTAYTASYVITQSDLSSGSIFNQATVSYTNSNDQLVLNASNSSVTTPLVEKPVVEMFNAISPNGDGDNDFLYIGGVEFFPENSLEIYNRWGVLVFERNGYNNIDSPFKGISEGRVTVNQNEELPAGTYYYVFKYKDLNRNQQEKVGYLYINR